MKTREIRDEETKAEWTGPNEAEEHERAQRAEGKEGAMRENGEWGTEGGRLRHK